MKHPTARLGRVLELGRAGVPCNSQKLARIEAFEQSPQCSLLATEGQLRIVAANQAMRLAAGYSETDLTQLSVMDLFRCEEAGEMLFRQLRNPSPQVPIRARQRTRGGAALEVEITGFRLRARGRTLLAFIVQDVAPRVVKEAAGQD